MNDDGEIGLPCKVCGRESTHDRLVVHGAGGSPDYEEFCREHAPHDADPIEEYVAVRVWRWEDAPREYRALVEDRDDIDWVAHVPAEMDRRPIPWLENLARRYFQVEKRAARHGSVYVGRHG